MAIQQAIEAIKLKREQEFLPKITKRIQHLEKLEKQIENLDSLMTVIKTQCEAKQGPYYAMLVNDAGMEMRLHQVSTIEVKRLLVDRKSVV